MIYESPGSENALIQFKPRYENFIDGKWTAPVDGQYFTNKSPVNGSVICEIARSNIKDIDLAVEAAQRAFDHWKRVNVADRATLLNKIADIIDQNHEMLAVAESWDNGKPIRETLDADIPLAADHFRYFAACIRAQESGLSQLDEMTVSYHHVEPLGVVGQIIPWNFPLLMAAWKLAPALAAGNVVVLKPAEQTPASIMVLMELIGDLLPPGTVNVVNGFGEEAGAALASHTGIDKIAFTGETNTGSKIMHNAANSLIPVTLELGGKSPNIFCDDVFNKDDDFKQKALEGFAMFAFNQGEVCTCPSRALIQENIADKFLEQAIARVKSIKQGNPLDTTTMIGAQASLEQVDKIMTYIDIGKQEGAELLCGGSVSELAGDLATGYYIQPTVFRGNNSMQIFQEEIFGPVVSVTTFSNDQDASYIANDSSYGLGAGVWSRDQHRIFRLTQAVEAGRIWVNNYHSYPAHAAFGGYKQSGIGRETHKMMLAHYQRTKNVLVSHDQNPAGLF